MLSNMSLMLIARRLWNPNFIYILTLLLKVNLCCMFCVLCRKSGCKVEAAIESTIIFPAQNR